MNSLNVINIETLIAEKANRELIPTRLPSKYRFEVSDKKYFFLTEQTDDTGYIVLTKFRRLASNPEAYFMINKKDGCRVTVFLHGGEDPMFCQTVAQTLDSIAYDIFVRFIKW